MISITKTNRYCAELSINQITLASNKNPSKFFDFADEFIFILMHNFNPYCRWQKNKA